MIDYRGKIVRKPWGFERLLVEVEDCSVAVWHLHLEPGQSTSMHMHRRKKTALVVLGGAAMVRFLSGDPKLLHLLGKAVFAPRQYHQTEARDKWMTTGMGACAHCPDDGPFDSVAAFESHLSLHHPEQPLDLLEIETPSDKTDLVRLEDRYGRAGIGYEGPEAMEESHARPLAWSGGLVEQYLASCMLRLTHAQIVVKESTPSMVIFLSGGIRKGSMPVSSPGAVMDAETLRRLASKYDLLPSEVLEVSR